MAERASRRRRWRPLLRSLHRDAGYLVVGLTVVYAVSGLAINHIDDWNPNFKEFERTQQLASTLDGSDQEIAARVASELDIDDPLRTVYRTAEQELTLSFDRQSVVVDLDQGSAFHTGEEPRFFLRAANWLHENRGKKAWTIVADGYAILLLFLAFSGMFMLAGKKGLMGRGGILVAIGAAVPIVYVVLSGPS